MTGETDTGTFDLVSMEPQIGIRGRWPPVPQGDYVQGVSMEPQIGIRGREPGAIIETAAHYKFQWSPR